MPIIRIIFGLLLTIAGIITAIIPVLPGPILSYIALLLIQFSGGHPFSITFLVVRGIVVAAVSLLDMFIPQIGIKRFGGTQSGITGSIVGVILAVIVLPFFGITFGPFGIIGLIAGPFLGAFLGEKLTGRHHAHALKSAFGSFLGFAAGTILKLVICIVMSIYFIIGSYQIIKVVF